MTLYIVRGLSGTDEVVLPVKLSNIDIVIATNDYPGLYIQGVHQEHLEKEYHEWCLGKVKEWLIKKPQKNIVVENTFIYKYFVQPYIDLAIKYEHYVKIIHVEATIRGDGSLVKSGLYMLKGWEPFNDAPRNGISLDQINNELLNLSIPDGIIIDLDSTFLTTSGRNFASSLDEITINPEITKFLKNIQDDGKIPIYLISDQQTIESGQKKLPELADQFKHFLGLLKDEDIELSGAYFSLKKEENRCFLWKKDGSEDMLVSYVLKATSNKPNMGIFEDILDKHRSSDKFWIIGNNCTDLRDDDWIFVQNCREFYPESKISFIPGTMTETALDLIDHRVRQRKYNENSY